ncbi:MAG: NAD(P)-dependent oxidoreductase [Geminicoccaceae bacterium]|nr:NAD(P)-dependent oxidoreductase [Geminicoccaceae bacterium]
MTVGVVGLGDMGSGLAKNLIEAGFAVKGFDLAAHRLQAFEALGGKPAGSAAEVGREADFVFVMVMTGAQAEAVILGDGLITTMAPGSTVLLTATIVPAEVEAIARGLEGSGIGLIDTPVSGGFPGAQAGTLTMMAAAPAELLERARPVMRAVSASIHHVGERAGMGQTVKACLQSIIGSAFAATFEAAALAAKAGIEGQVLLDVVQSSSAGSRVTETALTNIVDRRFEKTGSHIATMYKDLTITLDMARALGVPLFSAATAMQLFQAGKTRHPDGDNWVVTRVLEEIVGAELHRHGTKK